LNLQPLQKKNCCEEGRRIPSLILDNRLRYWFSNPDKIADKYVREGDVVADLGSGPGFYTIAFAKKVGKKGKVYAIDFDADAIDKLISKVKSNGVEDIVKAYAVSASKVDFIPDLSVDFVFANGLLCCMTDHEGAIRQIERILKPLGKAYLSVTRAIIKRDYREVSSIEWKQIISRFKVLRSREGIFQRTALVCKQLP